MSQEMALPVALMRRRRHRPDVSHIGPGTDVASYEVEARLGAGGFGTVFRAQRGGQPYALKLLELAEVGPSAIREVVSLSSVSHPHVVGLHGFWQWPDEQPRYLVVVMEYVPGRQLDVWTGTENPSALGGLRLVRGVARALTAVHAARLVHCDVKEANLIVREPEGEVVLVDFGVSSRQQTSPTGRGGLPAGTPDYRSPEAWRFWETRGWARGQRYQPTPADDLYALGVVLYWMLTNMRPFCTALAGGVQAVMEQAPQPPRERNPRVPQELSELCLRLLAKQPEARPTAAALCERVEELLTQQGEEWEQPLCMAFSEHNLTTEGQWVDDGTQWLKQEREQELRPRRGRRPPRLKPQRSPPTLEATPGAVAQAAPAAGAAPEVPPAVTSVVPGDVPAESPSTAQAKHPAANAHESSEVALPGAGESAPVAALAEPGPVRRVELARRVAALGVRARVTVGLGLLVAVGVLACALGIRGRAPLAPLPSKPRTALGAEPREGLEPEPPTSQGGWKVAPPGEPPEAERAAPPGNEGTAAASVEVGSTAPQHEASVNTKQQKQPKRLGPVKKAAALVGTCTTLACSGPSAEVRPPPVTAEPCPRGSLEAMEQLGIHIGDEEDAVFTWHKGSVEPVQVNEGWMTVRLLDDLGQLEAPTVLSGRIILTEKYAYGHFVQATTEQGKTYPVCLSYRGPRNDEGEVESTISVKAVREFK